MITGELITIERVCAIYKMEPGFMNSLIEFELITITYKQEVQYIELESFGDLEKMIRLHKDLGINAEGIDAILHLQKKQQELQEELKRLKAKLRLYE